jgi:hypothetical protein
LVLNLKDVDNRMMKYYHHGWASKSNPDTKLFFLCPNTYGERCPICKLSISMWKSNDPVQKEKSKAIRRRINDMVNFYVISDAKHPENNGTVKILKYGKQIEDKFKMALEGDDEKLYGPRVWRLDGEGCNFRIKCEQNSDAKTKESWPTYTNSGFLPPSTIEGMTPEKQKQIYDSAYDLTKQFERTSYQELEDALKKHFTCQDVISMHGGPSMLDNDEIPMDFKSPSTPSNSASPATQNEAVSQSTPSSTSTVDENDLDKMLEELQRKK